MLAHWQSYADADFVIELPHALARSHCEFPFYSASF